MLNRNRNIRWEAIFSCCIHSFPSWRVFTCPSSSSRLGRWLNFSFCCLYSHKTEALSTFVCHTAEWIWRLWFQSPVHDVPSRLLHYLALFLPPSHSVVFCLPPSSGRCVSVHPCMEIDLRHEYITTSHPCTPPPILPSSHHHSPPPLLRPISSRSLSQHLSQTLDLMHFNRRVYLPLSPPPPSFLWLWISGILQTNNNNKTTHPSFSSPSPSVPFPLF